MTPALFHLLYVSNFIKRRFGSLFGPNFGLHRIPIWSLFHPNLGPYLYAHRSLSVYQHLPTAQHLIFIHLSINSTIHSYIHPSICLIFPSIHTSIKPSSSHPPIQFKVPPLFSVQPRYPSIPLLAQATISFSMVINHIRCFTLDACK